MNGVVATVMLALTIGCSGSLASEESGGRWMIEIRTDGGFAGRGTGGVSIHSTGEVEATDLGGRACEARLSDAELATVAGFVRTARVHEWNEDYPTPGADMFHYKLTLVVGDPEEPIRAESGWLDGSVENLPSDLRAIFDEAWRLRSMVLSQCREPS